MIRVLLLRIQLTELDVLLLVFSALIVVLLLMLSERWRGHQHEGVEKDWRGLDETSRQCPLMRILNSD